jgi:hypothetical protein
MSLLRLHSFQGEEILDWRGGAKEMEEEGGEEITPFVIVSTPSTTLEKFLSTSSKYTCSINALFNCSFTRREQSANEEEEEREESQVFHMRRRSSGRGQEGLEGREGGREVGREGRKEKECGEEG